MNKTLVRVLAAILVLCMLPATSIVALAHGFGVAKDETENQSWDNANNQYIPETIQIDGEFDDTGWPIEGWNQVNASTGNWDVDFPEADTQGLRYQYQLRADYGYFYGAAVISVPKNVTDPKFIVYLNDTGSTDKTTTAIVFDLNASAGTITYSAVDCNTGDGLTPSVANIEIKDSFHTTENKYIFSLEFKNPVANTYDASASQVRFYVSMDVTVKDEDGNDVSNSLYHPIYVTPSGAHAVPTSEFWPGGGELLEVTYTDLDIRHDSSQYCTENPQKINSGKDGFKGAVDLDGKFNEDLWKGLTDYYTLEKDDNLAEFVNADKGIIGAYEAKKYKGTAAHLADISTVKYLEYNGEIVGKYDFRTDDEYFYGALITTSVAYNIMVGDKKVVTEYNPDFIQGYVYEFKHPKSDYDFSQPITVAVGTTENIISGLTVNNYDNNAADDVTDDGWLHESIWAPVTAGDTEFYYLNNNNSAVSAFEGYESVIYDVKTDYEYIYGAAIVRVEDITQWKDETVHLRMYISPYGHVGSLKKDVRYIVELYYAQSNDVYEDKSFARIVKFYKNSAGECVSTTSAMSYRWSELCYIRQDDTNNTLTFEFKIPYKLFSWKGAYENNEDLSGVTTEQIYPNIYNIFNTDINRADTDTHFVYYMSLCTYEDKKVTTETLFSKGMTGKALSIDTAGPNPDKTTYIGNATKVTNADIMDTVTIDGHIDEEVWQDNEFYHANFADSTVIDQPTAGAVYDYSYMIYGGSNYIYGAVELNDIAREGTKFTLWINNYIDEFAWIGDTNLKTPFITYDIRDYYSVNKTVDNKTYKTSTLDYFVNYKYEFDLSAVTATATPDYYFKNNTYTLNGVTVNGNLEQDKVWIKKDENYKYAVTTINGKTYLEFMIDVDNFHWDYNSFEYITSMTHTVQGVNGQEALTIYHPQFNDRSSFWLNGVNSTDRYRPDGAGFFCTSSVLYNDTKNGLRPPTHYAVSFKLKPVGNNQYQLVELTDNGTKWKLVDGKVEKSSWTKGTTAAQWHAYTTEDDADNIVMYISHGGQNYMPGLLKKTNDYEDNGYNVELHYSWANLVSDFYRTTIDGKPTHVNRTAFDGYVERLAASNKYIKAMNVGDIYEFGEYTKDFIENKDKNSAEYGSESGGKNTLTISEDVLSAQGDITTPATREIGSKYLGNQYTVKVVEGDDYVNGKYLNERPMPTSSQGNVYFGETEVKITSYSYTAETVLGTVTSGGNRLFDDDLKKLTDGVKLDHSSLDKDYNVLIDKNNSGNEYKEMGVITNIASGTTTNMYTAYLIGGGAWGIYANGINMSIYGWDSETESWKWVTAASYRQVALRYGDGVASKLTNESVDTNDDVDLYTITAVAEEPVTYSQIKFVFDEVTCANNTICIQQLEIGYSADVASLPKKTVLHLNTDQGVPYMGKTEGNTTVKTDEYQPYSSTGVTFLGRYNTGGATWDNTGESMQAPNTANKKLTRVNNVFLETYVFPSYESNTRSAEGMYSDYYIERVETNPLNHQYQPEDDGSDSWDKTTSGILQKLQHIAPDVIEVDGDLGDSGWDGTWTEVDGNINATNFGGTGTKYKYQLRADGEFLYVAAVINASADSDAPEFTLWIKGDEDATTYTNCYKIGLGSTELGITLPTSANAVEKLYYEYVNKDSVTDSKLVYDRLLSAIKNSSKTPNGFAGSVDQKYLESALYGYTKEVQESTHDGIWVWEANPVTQGYRFAIEQGCINSAAGNLIGNVSGEANQVIVEFRVALSEFDGADGFEYFVEAKTNSGSTIYPHVYTESGYADYHHPSWAWDSTSAEQVTPEDMTGWGIYRMVNDYAPMTSLGAKVNPNYAGDGSLTVRFAARYTEEFIRRIPNNEELDYWDVADAGIVILPTKAVNAGQELKVENENAVHAAALDIINWKNETADSKTNFADYTSFVFYVNLVGIPDTAQARAMEFSFCGYVDYYNVTDCDTFYGIPLVRSYDQVWEYANEEPNLPDGGTVNDHVPTSYALTMGDNAEIFTVSVGENEKYTPTTDNIISVWTDGNAPVGQYTTVEHDEEGFARLIGHTNTSGTAPASFEFDIKYDQEVAFNTVKMGIYTFPRWSVGAPSAVKLYTKVDGNWVHQETVNYTYTEEQINATGKNCEAYIEMLELSKSYSAQEIKLVVESSELIYVEGITNGKYVSDKYCAAVGLTELALAYTTK